MKQTYLNITWILLIVVGLTSCEKITTAGVSTVTYYVNLELSGKQTLIIPMGTPYIDPGYTAFEQGVDVKNKVEIISNLNTDEEGTYSITYSVVNVDGYRSSITRNIYVVDFQYPICGLYQTSIERTRAGVKSKREAYSIFISKSKTVDQEYNMDDFLGGWYSIGSEYGPDYAAIGGFKLHPDNTIFDAYGNVAGWGDAITGVTNSSFDPATGVLKFTTQYAGMDFAVTATKIQ